MTIFETLKKWVDVELSFTKRDIVLLNDNYKNIILYYFFGSCDLCAQAMDLDDNNFKSLYTDVITYIGISNSDINNVFEVWMLDKFSDKELFIIKHGARCFREFEKNPDGVGGLRVCFSKFSENKK
tara:strand:- start:469 stop:846 length:378 start_codon:yes stop_codon:yes gene_type:complete